VQQPQPKCGFVIAGTKGTISAYDYATRIRVQTLENPVRTRIPADEVREPYISPIHYLVHCLDTGAAVSGPLAPEIARIGQQIVDSAVLSAREKRTVPLVE
jgi:glucose-fructose oxidoreductase